MAILLRRDFLGLCCAATGAALLPGRPFATTKTGTALHGLSAFGDLKYPADFQHFDYVNPEAPKGGTMNFAPPNSVFNQSFHTFNTLNSLMMSSEYPPLSTHCIDKLMSRPSDHPVSV